MKVDNYFSNTETQRGRGDTENILRLCVILCVSV
jgi:hypothetical protein